VRGSLLVLGGSWRLVKTMQQIDAEILVKSSNKRLEESKIVKNGRKIHAKSLKNDRGDALGDLGCPLDVQVGGGTSKSERPG
jgi:hypothetical protein